MLYHCGVTRCGHWQVWECTDDRPTWTVIQTMENAHPVRINCLASVAGHLVSAANDASLKVWNPNKEWALVFELQHHTAQINQLMPVEDLLYTCSHDRHIKVGAVLVH